MTLLREAREFDAEIHVYPLDDLVTHVLDGTGCPCGVAIEDGPEYRIPMVTHNSLDGRELVYG